MDIIAFDNTKILIEAMRKFEKDHAHTIRRLGFEDEFLEFMWRLECHKDNCEENDPEYQEKEA